MLKDLVLFWTVFLCGGDSSPLPGEEQGSSSLSVTCCVLGGAGLGVKMSFALEEKLVVADGEGSMAR